MLKRFFNPIQVIAGAGIAVVLTVVVLWILNTPQSQPPDGLTIQITPAQTQAGRQATQATPTLEVEHEDIAATPTPPRAHQPTATITAPSGRASGQSLDSAYRTREEPIADADLNCDGMQERVVSIDAYYGHPKADKTNRIGSIGVALQTPTQQGHQQVWEYWCDLKDGQPTCDAVVALLLTNDCEQFITFNTRQQLIIFRWNGKDMSVVLDARANFYSSTQDPFVLTAIMRNSCTSPARCDETLTNYAWNGTEFVEAEAALPLRAEPTRLSSAEASSQAQDETPTPTPKPTMRATPASIGTSLKTEQIIVADVDLNCDGLQERVVKTETYSNFHSSQGTPVPHGIAAIAIQVPAQQGYQQAWEYLCELNEHRRPMCHSVLVNLIPAGHCEQFITFNGIFSLEGGWRLKVFRWNGQEGLLVLNEPGGGFVSTQDPFIVTTTLSECTSGRCRETQVNYAWNGAEFVQQ